MISFLDWLYYNVFLSLLPLVAEFFVLALFASEKLGMKKVFSKPLENGSLFMYSAILAITSISSSMSVKPININQYTSTLAILLFFSAASIGTSALQQYTGGIRHRNVVLFTVGGIVMSIATTILSFLSLVK